MAFGDFTVTRASTKNVLGSDGLYVSVANNVPAFEFNADGSYKGLLVEPAATNLALRSQEFDTTWTNAMGGSGVNPVVTANAGVSPDGTTTADRIQLDAGAGTLSTDFSILLQNITSTAVAHTFSVWLKSFDGTDQFISLRFNSTPSQNITITADWQRFSFTGTPIAGSRSVGFDLRGNNPSGEKTSDFLAWQAQVETGPVATSPIVTAGSTATRVADTIALTGASSLIGQTEGTLYAEVEMRDLGAVSRTIFDVSDGTLNNRFSLFATGAASNTYRFFAINGGASQAQIDSAFTPNAVDKLGWAYKANDFAAYRNGAQIGLDASGTIPTTSVIRLGSTATDIAHLNGWIRSAALFPTRLTNDQLASLTTL